MDKITFENRTYLKTKYEGYYVCKEGFIISVKTRGYEGMFRYDNPKYHSVKKDKDGYFEVCLSITVDGVQKRIYRRLHRLIWETLNGDIPKGMTIDHIDNVKTNNNLNNLQLLSRSENTAKANKRRKGKTKNGNVNRSFYKLTINDIESGVFDRRELIDKYNISPYHITQINKGNYPKILKEKGIILERV